MIRVTFSGTFGSRHQIIPSKDIYFQGLGQPCRGRAVYISRLRRKGQPEGVKLWPKIKLKKTLKLSKIVWGTPFGNFCSQYQIVLGRDTNL